MANLSQNQLRMMINQMVEQAVGEKMSQRQKSWSSNWTPEQARLSYFDPEKNRKSTPSGANSAIIGRTLDSFGDYLQSSSKFQFKKYADDATPKGKGQYNAGAALSAIGGGFNLYSALRSGNGMGAMQAGQQIGSAIGQMTAGAGATAASAASAIQNAGLIGMGVGLLLSLFGRKKTTSEWNRPKFKDAETAYNKLFTVDRGERDSYYMPESFYFRNGWSGARHIVVKVGNEQFNDHIKESMTDSYANQLQRGLVF